MSNIQKILVPVDFSASSMVAIETAADLAKCHRASLTLLHVHDPFPYARSSEDLSRSPEESERLRLELCASLAVAKQRADAAGVADVEARLVDGTVPAKILELAAVPGFDLIVMGTGGRTRLEHDLLGSVAEGVVLRAPCPVLTVRASLRGAAPARKLGVAKPSAI